MSAVLLVAVREIRQVLGTRGFWVMLLIVPLALAVSTFASSKLAPERSIAFTIVDRTGRFAPELERRIELGGPPCQLNPIHLWHHDVGQQQIEIRLLDFLKGARPLGEGFHLVTGAFKRAHQVGAHALIVFG